jgi:hypothetical protein
MEGRLRIQELSFRVKLRGSRNWGSGSVSFRHPQPATPSRHVIRLSHEFDATSYGTQAGTWHLVPGHFRWRSTRVSVVEIPLNNTKDRDNRDWRGTWRRTGSIYGECWTGKVVLSHRTASWTPLAPRSPIQAELVQERQDSSSIRLDRYYYHRRGGAGCGYFHEPLAFQTEPLPEIELAMQAALF